MSTPNTPETAQHAQQPAQQQPAQQQQQQPPAQQPVYRPAYAPGQQQPVYRAAGGPAASPAVTTVGGTNTYAMLAIILAFIAPIAGIVFGHMGLSQIKRTGDGGRGLALTGLILGYASFAVVAIFFFMYAFMLFAILGSIGSMSGFDDPSLYDYSVS